MRIVATSLPIEHGMNDYLKTIARLLLISSRRIEELLVKYYDPMYDYQLKNNNERGRVLFQGNEDAVKQFIQDKIKNKSK